MSAIIRSQYNQMSLQKFPHIWADSPSSLNYVSSSAIIDKSKRFQFNSIYYRDDSTKPKKKIDQLLFPFQILHDFRKCIRDARKLKSKDAKLFKKHSSQKFLEKSKLKLNSKASEVTTRLYQKPQILPETRDFFGIRSSLNERTLHQICNVPLQPNKSLQKSSLSKNIYITASQRLDFSKPINFNPGPGSYNSGSGNDLRKNVSAYFNIENSQLKRKEGDKSKCDTTTKSTDFKNQ